MRTFVEISQAVAAETRTSVSRSEIRASTGLVSFEGSVIAHSST